MNNGKVIVAARCASCHRAGWNHFRVCDGNGKVFWSGEKKYAEIAESQRGSDALISADPYSHIPWVASCEHAVVELAEVAKERHPVYREKEVFQFA